MRLLGWQCMHVSSRQDKPSVRRPEIEWSDPGGATNTSRGLTHSLEAPRRGCREGYPNPTSMSDMWITHRPRSRTACVLLRRMSPHLRAPHMRPPTRGMQTVCDSHRVQLDRHGELRPDTWSKEWVCVVCGAGVPKGSGRRKHCSRAVSKPTLDTTGVAQRRRNVGYAGRTSPYSGAPGRGFSAPTLSGAAPAVENPRSAPISEVRNHPGGVRGRDESGLRHLRRARGALHIDHDHSCCPPRSKQWRTCGQCVRGFLCGSCNRGLGLLKDDPNVLRSAIEYLGRKA
ncbi:endonuclease domain-containing protein [Gordonia westfalica]|uniref:Recombination endonuclease VII n=1 Tax=Gordonia westfalica TaxID=158898 RepID=A0A1H2DLJ3_9ACTN|nr:Recombination endonuclease VII [Gordonia westfalica]